jgi:two-component system, OmpR family, sensor histidine kinase TctE
VFDSLRSQLLAWLLAPLALVAAIDAWATYRSAQETATIVQERMLLGAARVIGEQVHLEEGVIQVVIPPAALELFASPSRDRVFYRASAEKGVLLSGYYDLALPPHLPRAEEAVYFDAIERERPVHVVGFAQPVFAAPERGPVLIEVAQTLEGRDRLAREIWGMSISRQLALLVLVGVLLWLGLRRGMVPLLKLRDRVLERRPGSVDRLDESAVPAELRPLVLAVNDYAQRLDRHMSAHSRFIADASHQLRTPLTLLNTQVVYALRHDEPAGRQDALQAIHASVQHGVRLVQQLLSWTMAEAIEAKAPALVPVDLSAVVRRVLEAQALTAGQRGIDLGLRDAGAAAMVRGHAQLLQELVANLVDNALRYTPRGGIVTAAIVRSAGALILRVEDNGPGIPESERERVFERFHRLHDGDSDGCGLGLAIVREIARSHGASVRLSAPPSGIGLFVDVTFAAAPASEPR